LNFLRCDLRTCSGITATPTPLAHFFSQLGVGLIMQSLVTMTTSLCTRYYRLVFHLVFNLDEYCISRVLMSNTVACIIFASRLWAYCNSSPPPPPPSQNAVLHDRGDCITFLIILLQELLLFLVQLQKFTLIKRPTMSVKLVVLYKSEL